MCVNPVIELVNTPVAVPSVVWLPVAIGFTEVLQQTPLAVTIAPPFPVILPPLVAVVCVMLLAAVVVRVGTTGVAELVVNVISLPYAVPTLFVAYALT